MCFKISITVHLAISSNIHIWRLKNHFISEKLMSFDSLALAYSLYINVTFAWSYKFSWNKPCMVNVSPESAWISDLKSVYLLFAISVDAQKYAKLLPSINRCNLMHYYGFVKFFDFHQFQTRYHKENWSKIGFCHF